MRGLITCENRKSRSRTKSGENARMTEAVGDVGILQRVPRTRLGPSSLPLATVETIYEKLELGDFEYARPKLQAFLDTQRNYRRNTYEMDPELRNRIHSEWSDYVQRYGYGDEA